MPDSLITPNRMANMLAALKACAEVDGDVAELGVYKGGSAYEIALACPKRLHLFDGFKGLPYTESRADDPEGYCPQGRFACDEWGARLLLAGRNATFHVGLFPGTAKGLEHLRFAFVHVDCDQYRSAKDAIEWFWPRLNSGGVLFFDDYNCDFFGVTRAVNEAFKPEDIVQQNDGQYQIGCYVEKT